MFTIDTFRLIKKTFRRFFNLTLIVLIGVAFMMGLFSTPTIMRKSVDKYNDEYVLHDIQIYSQYGFCDKDVYALSYPDGIDQVFASKYIDVYAKLTDGSKIVTRVSEIERNIDKVELLKGRLPEKDNECVVLEDLSSTGNKYIIGEHLRLEKSTGDLKDNLKYDDYLIVGIVRSVEYLSKTLGASNCNNKDLNTIIYIPKDNFVFEYYTTIYLTLDNSNDYLSYSKEYEEFINENIVNVQNMAVEQQEYLKDKILKEANAKLKEGILEFEEKKKEGEEELADAKKRLDDANIQIITAKSQLTILEEGIKQAQATIDNNSTRINELESELSSELSGIGLGLNASYEDILALLVDPNYDQEVILRIAQKKLEYDTLVEFINTAQITLEKTNHKLDETRNTIKNATYSYNSGLKKYDEAVLTFNDEIEKAQIELKKVQQEIDELPKAKWTILDRTSHYASYMFDATCKQMETICFIMPFLFYLVAALVCSTTMTRLIDEQRGQIGIFRALGYRKSQIISKYVIYALLASLIGSVIGIFIGQLLFPTVIYKTWRLMYDLPSIIMVYPIKNIIICTLAFSLLMCTISALLVLKLLSEVPAELMRPKAPKNAKTILLEKIKFIWERLSFTSKITARNIFRYKSRFFMTLIGVAGCTSLLVLGFGIKDSISDIIEIQFGKIFNYDYQLYFSSDHYIDSNVKILEENLDNEIVVPYMAYTSRTYFSNDEKTINVMVIDQRDAIDIFSLREIDRRTPLRLDNNGVIISQKFAINNDIKVGDYITIESKSAIKQEVKVEAICEMYFQHYVFISNAYYESVFEENVHDNYISIKTNNKDKLLSDIETLDDYVSIIDFSLLIYQFENMINALNLIILVIIITSGSLAFVVIINLSQVNISERTREIATLKVLGFHNFEVNNYIFKEVFILTIIGALIGLPLGIVEHHFIMNMINMEMVMFGMNINLLSYAVSFLITIVFTIIVMMFMKKTLRKIDMIESLKSVE